jgi:hypothetical protein
LLQGRKETMENRRWMKTIIYHMQFENGVINVSFPINNCRNTIQYPKLCWL